MIGSDCSGGEGLIISRVSYLKDLGSCNVVVCFVCLFVFIHSRASKMIDDNASRTSVPTSHDMDKVL